MNEPNAFLRWIECHPSLAGYVQAIGVIAAVGVAFFAPRISAYFEERRQLRVIREATRVTFATLQSAAAEVRTSLTKIRIALDSRAAGPPAALAWREWFEKEIFCPIPVALEFQHQNMGVDTDALELFERLRQAIANYNTERLNFQTNYGSLRAEGDWERIWQKLSTLHDKAMADCVEALDAIYRP